MLRKRVLTLTALAIAAFWLAMMALLVRRELLLPYFAAGHGGLVIPAEPTDVWLGLLLNDAAHTPIGYINIRNEAATRDAETGVQMQFLGRMRLDLGSFKGELAMNGDAWATPKDGLRAFSFSMRSGEHSTRIAATIEQGRVRGAIDTGGEKTPIDLAVGDAAMLTSAPGLGAFTMPSLEVGDEVFVESFDPLTMSSGKARVRCIAEESIESMGRAVPAKVVVTDLSGIKTKAWVDSRGNVMRAETPIGFVLERMDAADALKLPGGDGTPAMGLLEFAAINPLGRTPFRGATRAELVITGLEGIANVPTDDAQTPGEDGKLAIAPQGPAEDPAPLSDVDRAAALANDAFLQIDHPKIADKAREIVGAETDDWKKATLIYDWVHRSIKKNIVPSLPTSLDVLNTMEGDCNEHTVLFTALARAAGVPARMA
ncbi:MAG: transglutaminase domain-containing protein, partial [Candidatus Hydrogenedentes bacterium]|nr:transglutaminase domain-containing protein [Candidatus Hydrogenedentota bacterium]